jgi:hypothetical protein
MSDIRWVCLSDTHFGAENSVLSHVPAGQTHVDPGMAGPVLEALCDCLRDLLTVNDGAKRPTLVLNGDVLEFALASDNVAAMVFDRFVDLSFSEPDPIFDDTIVYIPGNHDHHIWETARERQYAAYVASVPAADPLGAPWHATRLFQTAAAHVVESELLTALVRRRTDSRLRVQVVYPNLGLVGSSGTSAVVLHHGHLIEPMYRLMSLVESALFPGRAEGPEVWDWEADNFAWIDFFWSTLGRSGTVGQDVGFVYDMLQDPNAVASLANNLGHLAAEHSPWFLRPFLAPACRFGGRFAARRAADRERARHGGVLSASAQAGLAEYLSGPLHRQLARECEELLRTPVTFVFGHTHKPFEALQVFPGYDGPVALYNTGGWVVDTEQTAPLHGASVVVIGEDGDVASLRMYNQAESASAYTVRLADELPGRSSDLRQRLAGHLGLSAGPWKAFSNATAAAVEQRHLILPRLIDEGIALTRRGGRP